MDRKEHAEIRGYFQAQVASGTARLERLLAERTTLSGELEFYPETLPRKLRRMLEDSNYEIAAVKRAINTDRCLLAHVEARQLTP